MNVASVMVLVMLNVLRVMDPGSVMIAIMESQIVLYAWEVELTVQKIIQKLIWKNVLHATDPEFTEKFALDVVGQAIIAINAIIAMEVVRL